MGGFLRYSRLLPRHLRVSISVAPYIFSGYDLVPHARRRIASVRIIEVVAVSAHRIAKFGFPCVLDSRATRNQNQFTI